MLFAEWADFRESTVIHPHTMHFRPVPIAALVCGPSDSHLAYETVVSCSHLSSASVINFIANLVLKGGIYKLHNSLLDSNFFPLFCRIYCAVRSSFTSYMIVQLTTCIILQNKSSLPIMRSHSQTANAHLLVRISMGSGNETICTGHVQQI